MKGSEAKFLGFLEGADKRYIIPVYQRKYDWKLDNCRQLYEDLKRIVLDKRDSHFFGSIVSSVVANGSIIEYHIIDGQQRITTITLLLLAISNLIKQGKIQSSKEKLDEQISHRFLISPWANEDDRIKLYPVKSDKDALARLFGPVEDYDPSSNLTLNYRFFCEQLLRGDISIDELFDAIGKLEVICITLDYGDNAQLIFESLNSTGLALTEGDKIRNYILMGQPPKEQTKLFDSYWTVIERCTAYDVSGFVRDYLSVKTMVTPTISNVYKAFKGYAEGARLPIETLMEDLRRYARLYEKLLTCKSGLGIQKLDDCLYRMMRLEIVVTRPFLMEVLRLNQDCKISSDDVLNVFLITENYLFRRNICDVPTNALNKIFLNLNKEILRFSNNADDYVHKLVFALKSKKDSGRFPDDEEFANALSTKPIYQMRGKYKAYLFERFENYGTIETKDVYTHLDNNIYTIEHIMPQHLTPAWYEALGENAAEIHNTWLHRLANLTLTGYNPSLSNKTFQEKRDSEDGGYKASGLKMNQKISMKEEWGLLELEERNTEMISLALKIWQCPESSFIPVEKSFDTCTLDEDNVDLTGRDLAKYSYQNIEQPVNSWSDMFGHVLQFLHQKDKSVLSGLAYKAINGTDLDRYVSGEEANLRNPLKIDEGIFVELNTSTVLKLSILRRLFTLYGADPMDLVFFLKDGEVEDEGDQNRDILRRKYWEYLIPKLQSVHKDAFSKAKPNKWAGMDGYFNCGIIHLFCAINFKPKEVAVGMWIDCGDRELNKGLFDFLYSKRFEIKSKVSYPIIWDRNDAHRSSKLRCVLSGCDISNEQEWPVISEFHVRASNDLANSVFYAYENDIRSRFDKRASSPSAKEDEKYVKGSWVIPCNPNYYDVAGAFNEFDTIEWSQAANMKEGDVVYIYVSGNIRSIMYKTTVLSSNHFGFTSEKDLKYYKNLEHKEKRYMVLHLEEKYSEGFYPYEELKQNGLNTVQGPNRVSVEFDKYLKDKV